VRCCSVGEDGLSNEELSHCNWLLTIPMQQHADVRHASMNLGQAVAVCLYELARKPAVPAANGEAAGNGERIQSPAPADAATLERLTALLTEVLEKTGYPRVTRAKATRQRCAGCCCGWAWMPRTRSSGRAFCGRCCGSWVRGLSDSTGPRSIPLRRRQMTATAAGGGATWRRS